MSEKRNAMNEREAEQKSLEWNSLHDDANTEEECECFSAAERLRDQARDIEKELEAAGYNATQLLRRIQSRRK